MIAGSAGVLVGVLDALAAWSEACWSPSLDRLMAGLSMGLLGIGPTHMHGICTWTVLSLCRYLQT